MTREPSRLLSLRRQIGRLKRNLMRKPEVRWGQDFLLEVKRRVPSLPRVIFDVGGHRGESALRFSDAFPDSAIYTFEPSPENFSEMDIVLAGKPSIVRLNFALGASPSVKKLFHDSAHSSMSRISISSDCGYDVKVFSIDQFAKDNDIEFIDILKIDTEGYEMEVLEGAKEMLGKGNIRLLKIECGVDPDEEYHTPLRILLDLLEPIGYRVFGFYEQYENVFSSSKYLSRVDIALLLK